MGGRGNSLRVSAKRLLMAAMLLGLGSGAVVYGGKQAVVFDGLPPEYAQHVFGTTEDELDDYLGGIVVMQNGDVIAAECKADKGAKLHRFVASQTYTDHDTTLHQEIEKSSGGGCGITLHPDGFIYSNMRDGSNGVAKINPATGSVVDKMGLPGNAVGIAVDPVTLRIVYTDQGCKPGFLKTRAAACQIVELDPVTKTTRIFASFPTPTNASVPYLNGIAFDPTGQYLLVTRRQPTKTLLVLSRTGAVLNQVALANEPIGLGFHAAPDEFVVTTNVNGSITRLDFHGDYLSTPDQSDFAYGADRTDLAQAGPDGCLYISKDGTVYDDGEEAEYDDHGKKPSSIIQICEGFVPPPGIVPNPPPLPSSMCGFVYNDVDNDGVMDAGEPGIAGVSLSLTGTDNLGRDVARTTTSGPTGTYCFNALRTGTYTVTEVQPSGYLDGKDADGTTPVGVIGSDTFSSLALAAGVADNNNNFGELLASSVGGYVYVDANGDGILQAAEAGIAGATVTLTGTDDRGTALNMPTVTGTDGSYSFAGLRPGTYTVTETQPATYLDGADTLGTPGTGTVGADVFAGIVLAQGVAGANNNFGELAPDPRVAIVITSNGAEHNTAPGPIVAAGSTLAWTYSVSNTGNVALSGLTVTDSQATSIACPVTTLQPGATVACTGSSVAARDASQLVAVVMATGPLATTVSSSDTDYYFGGAPALSVIAKTNDLDNDSGTGLIIPAGSTVTWTYVVQNTGNVPLSGITVSDDHAGAAGCPTTLAPGASFTCTVTGIAVAGQFTNVATVTATDPLGTALTAQAGDGYFGSTPSISILTTTNDTNNDSGTGPYVAAGSSVKWSYVITNTGNVVLSNVVVADDRIGTIACPAATVAVGASITCTGTGTAVAGQYVNTGTVTATDPNNTAVTAQNSDRYFGSTPSISIITRTNGSDNDSGTGPYIPAGTAVTWTYVLQNTGNVALSNVTVVDSNAGTVTGCPGTLAPGATVTCTANGTAVAGAFANTATVTAKDPLSTSVTAQNGDRYFGSTAAVKILTTTNGTDNETGIGPYLAPGSSVTWTYLVENKGNVPLTNVVVSDNKAGTVACPATLAAGATFTCTATGTAVAGAFTNTATVTATPPVGPAVTATNGDRYFGSNPAISVVVKTNGSDSDAAPGPSVAVGSPVTWTYAIVNTGNVPLTNVVVTDGGTVCTQATLAAGASLSCTKSGTATAGQNTSTGAVTANAPLGKTVTAQNVDYYFGVNAAVSIVTKTNGVDNESGTGPSIAAGAAVTWTYYVVNAGNVPLSNIVVTDNKVGAVTCPATTLAAGANMTCTKTGTAVAGQYNNVGTVTATGPLGSVTASNGDRYLGTAVVDKTAPGCVVQTFKGPPFKGTMAFTDTGSGLATLTITTNLNFKVTIPAFTKGTKSTITVTATRIDERKSAQLIIKATDVAGNAIDCDPVYTTVTKLKQDNGNQTWVVPQAEHILTITNGDPGLRKMQVEVNGVMFVVRKLEENEVEVLDVQSAMHRGDNTITLIPKGKKGETADVIIADQAFD